MVQQQPLPPLPLEKRTEAHSRRQRGQYKRMAIRDTGDQSRASKEIRVYGETGTKHSSWDIRVTRQVWRRGLQPSHMMNVTISQEDATTIQNWAQEEGMSVSVFIAWLCHCRRNKMLMLVPDGLALEDIYDKMFVQAMERRMLSIEKDIRKRFKGLEDEVRSDWMTFRE